MFIPKHSGHHHHYTGAPNSSPRPHYDLINNPLTIEITITIAVVSFAILLLLIAKCLRPGIAPDPPEEEEDDDEQEEEEEEQPRDFTPTEDGTLIDNESGRLRQYGTFYTDGKFWYNADGVEMSYNEWLETVYDPLD